MKQTDIIIIKMNLDKQLEFSDRLRWHTFLVQANWDRLDLVWVKVVYIACLCKVCDVILHLLKAQW